MQNCGVLSEKSSEKSQCPGDQRLLSIIHSIPDPLWTRPKGTLLGGKVWIPHYSSTAQLWASTFYGYKES